MKKIIPVFFACDDAFVKFTAVTMKSIMDNANTEDYKYIFYVLNTNIKEETTKAVLEMQNESFEIHFTNVSRFFDSLASKLHVRDYYSKTTYFRLFIAEMFPEYDKAIYIDSDVIVPGDLSEFYNHDLGNNLVGACNEQAMYQTDVYGTYVEKCIGLDRYHYFNAGHILINCKLWREEAVLNQFIDRLNEYNFVVTQDEDYLNLICFNRVLWICNCWNVEVYGDINFKNDEIKMIHFIMWAKPWHFSGVRLEEFFWEYAKKTVFYDEIKAILDAYTDEQRANDLAAGDRLAELAIFETNRPDNYVALKKAGKI